MAAPEHRPAPVAVVHLARCANGDAVLQSFLKSYSAFSSGIEHELIVVLKGYERDPRSKGLALDALRPYRALTLAIPDDGLDLDAYRAAANAFDCSYYCFLNSFSRIATDGWLGKMVHFAGQSKVGIVGVTGSYQSIRSDELNALREMVAWHFSKLFLRSRSGAHGNEQVDPALTASGTSNSREFSPPSAWARSLWLEMLDYARRAKWTLQVIWHFPGFPNPHVRTNGFVLSRRVIDRVHWPRLGSKLDAYCMESGQKSLTAQVVGMGLEPVLVGKDGRGYSREEWPASRIFWQGEQENLLLKDNQTLQYEFGSAEERRRLCRHAWHDRSSPGV